MKLWALLYGNESSQLRFSRSRPSRSQLTADSLDFVVKLDILFTEGATITRKEGLIHCDLKMFIARAHCYLATNRALYTLNRRLPGYKEPYCATKAL